MNARRGLLLGVSIAALALAAPSSAIGQDSSDSPVAGVGGAELSLAVATPAVMTLLYSTPGTATSLVTVTSTSPDWTLSISDEDASGSGTPGHMDAVDCVTSDPLGVSLFNPLQWSSDGGFSNLSDTPATVATGSLIEAHTVTYQQELDTANDEVALADCFQLTATYTVTDS